MSSPGLSRILKDSRFVFIAIFGFASGLPYMLTGRTLKVWAANQKIDLTTVGLLSLVTLPYSFKFIWAPLMDRFSLPLVGRRRGWLAVWQLALAISIAMMALLGPHDGTMNALPFACAAIAVAFFSASQDIVEAGYRTDLLTDAELPFGASMSVMGYRAAMLVTGAGAVALSGQIGWNLVYGMCALFILFCIGASFSAPAPISVIPPATLSDAVILPFRNFYQRFHVSALAILLFIVLFKLPDYMASALIDAMLLKLGYTVNQISLWSLGLGTAVTIPGVAVGGLITAKLGFRSALLILGCAQAISNLGYLTLTTLGHTSLPLMVSVVAIEYFCAGLVAAGFVAYLMSLCDRRFSATQFALLTGLMGLSASLGGAPTGFLADKLGYSGFLLFTVFAGVPGLALIFILPKARALDGKPCPACGYDLRAAASHICPECGTPIEAL